jgi:hypothetical protein
MRSGKDLLLRIVEVKARRRTGQLAGRLIRASAEAMEPILAELEFERWLADRCRDCRNGS